MFIIPTTFLESWFANKALIFYFKLALVLCLFGHHHSPHQNSTKKKYKVSLLC